MKIHIRIQKSDFYFFNKKPNFSRQHNEIVTAFSLAQNCTEVHFAFESEYRVIDCRQTKFWI